MKIKKLINHVVMIVVTVICSLNPNFAQDSSDVSLDFGTDLVSRYVWRGSQFGGTSPNVQPYTELGIGNFVLGAWGSYSLGGSNPFQEFDFYAAYSLLEDKVSITLTDYYFPDESADYNYFNYDANTTGHVLEAIVSFNGTEKIPFSAFLATNFFGNDATSFSDDSATLNKMDGIQYSMYLELGYATTLKSVDFEAFLGINLSDPSKPDFSTGYMGETGYYGKHMGVVNLGITVSKEVEISDKFTLPVMASLITNPQAQKIFMVFGISF